MYAKIIDTGKGFKTYEEQVAAKMELQHIHSQYYALTSVDPNPMQICEMFGWEPVEEVPPIPYVPSETEVLRKELEETKLLLDDMILNSPVPALQAAVDELILNGGI